MTPATYILFLVLGWLALSLAILWAMLRLARRSRPLPDTSRAMPRQLPSAPVTTRKHLAC